MIANKLPMFKLSINGDINTIIATIVLYIIIHLTVNYEILLLPRKYVNFYEYDYYYHY